MPELAATKTLIESFKKAINPLFIAWYGAMMSQNLNAAMREFCQVA